MPIASSQLKHLLAVGASGAGKTEMILGPVCEWGVQHGYQVIYLSCKEPASVEQTAAVRLAEVAAEHGASFKSLIPELSPFDAMRGSLSEVRDRFVRIEEWGDRYWQHCANLLVGLALELSAESGTPIHDLPALVFALVKGRLKELARESADRRVLELVPRHRTLVS